MKQHNPLAMLGMATRAGKVVTGEMMVIETIRARKARLVIVSVEASGRTQKTYGDKCRFYRIPLRIDFTKEELGRATGRASCTACAVTDAGLSEAIMADITFCGGEENG